MFLKKILHILNIPVRIVIYNLLWPLRQNVRDINNLVRIVIYNLLWAVNFFILRIIYNPEIKNKENFPKKDVFILASNHEDNTDPLFLCSLTHRSLHFLAHEGLFRPPTRSRFVMKYLDQICVVYGKSSLVVKNSVKFLKEGRLVAIFPEGTIDDGKKIIREHTGVARIAIKSGYPVLPVAITNSLGIMPKGKRFFKKMQKVKINIGELMYFNKYKGQDENRKITKKVTHDIMEEIRRLYRTA